MLRIRSAIGNWATIVLLATAVLAGAMSCAAPTGPSSDCGDCPSSVHWDSNVERCRNDANGQFAKSCCCGR